MPKHEPEIGNTVLDNKFDELLGITRKLPDLSCPRCSHPHPRLSVTHHGDSFDGHTREIRPLKENREQHVTMTIQPG